MRNYNDIIKAVGNEIFNNKEKVLGGTYERKTKEITAIHTEKRGLDFQTIGPPKTLGVEYKAIDAPYQESLDRYNSSKTGSVNCTTIEQKK